MFFIFPQTYILYSASSKKLRMRSICPGKYYISIYRSRKVAVGLLCAQLSERETHVVTHATDCVSEVTNLLKELR